MPPPISEKVTDHRSLVATSSTVQGTVDTETTPHSGNTTDSSSTPFENLASLISLSNKWNFRSPSRLAYRIRVKIGKCLQARKGCYVYVSGVSTETLTKIDDALEIYGIRKQVRMTFEPGLNGLIVKLMAGIPHERISWTFMSEITDKICQIPNHGKDSYHPTGCGRYCGKSGNNKEADGGLAPAGTRDGEEAWPSVVLEVGDAQRMDALQKCAVWWLTESHGQTRMAILIKLTKDPINLRFELWEMIRNPQNPGTESRPRKFPGFEQFFEVNSEGEITDHHKDHPNLVIPYLIIFDLPHDDAIDITLTQADIKAWTVRLCKGLSWD